MRLSDTAIRRSVGTTMVMAALAIFGILSLRNLGLDLFPKVDFPVITVFSVLPGADPHTVETNVSKPIEDAVSTISSIKHLRSTSAEGISQVVIEFELEKNVDIAFQEVQAKLGSIRSTLPTDLEDPVVEKFDIDSAPIMTVVVSGCKPVQEISHIADKVVKGSLQQIHGVGQIKLIGNQERNIWIYLDPYKLEGFSLSVQEVMAALKAHHIDLPGGRIQRQDQEVVVKTKAEFDDVAQFNDLLVAYRNDCPIHLSDVGMVVDGLEEERSLARLDDHKAVALLIRRQSGTNTVSVAQEVRERVEQLRAELQNEGLQIQIAQDLSVYIERSVGEIWTHLIIGGSLAVVIVFVFLRNLRMTLISAVAIPLSVLATFICMHRLNFTMNSMTMLALSLSIGILIDDAIVVVESIYRHFKKGDPAELSSSVGTGEIGPAAVAITLSIVAVFVPVACMRGIVGRFMNQFALTVTICVMMSLFISLTLTPMLASKFLKKETYAGRFSAFIERLFSLIDAGYIFLLKFALRHRASTLLISCIFLAATFGIGRLVHSEFLPMEDQSEFNIKVRTPLGSPLSRTDQILAGLRREFEKEPWVKYTLTTIGTDHLSKVNEGSIYVKMQEKDIREIGQIQAMESVRKRIEPIADDNKISIEAVPRVSEGSKRACSIQVDIQGENLAKVQEICQSLIAALQHRKGYVDLDLSYNAGKPEYEVSIKRDRAAALFVTPSAIAQTIKMMIGGVDATKYTVNGERYNVSLRLQDAFRNRPEDILPIGIKNAFGESILLGNLVEVSKQYGPVQIDRDNKERIISVYVNLEEGIKTLGQGVSEISELLQGMQLPPGYRYHFSGMADVMKESFSSLLSALVIAVCVVYMVLASQFESFIYPCIIMLSLPFSLIGAIGALVLTDSTLNINTIIGIIMLMGLVTKNAILLVDYANSLRRTKGLSTDQALVTAGATRLHPILMTTLAMIFGMLPIALSQGDGSEARSPMAIATIGGLTTSMLLTLVVVPVAYAVIDSWSSRSKSGEKYDLSGNS